VVFKDAEGLITIFCLNKVKKKPVRKFVGLLNDNGVKGYTGFTRP